VTATRMTRTSIGAGDIVVFDAASLDARGALARMCCRCPDRSEDARWDPDQHFDPRISNTLGGHTGGHGGYLPDDVRCRFAPLARPGNSLPMCLTWTVECFASQGRCLARFGGGVRFISVERVCRRFRVTGGGVGFTRMEGFLRAGAAQGGPSSMEYWAFGEVHDRHEGVHRPHPFPVSGSLPRRPIQLRTQVGAATLLWSPSENLKITPSIYFRETTSTTSHVLDGAVGPVLDAYVSGTDRTRPTRTSRIGECEARLDAGPGGLISTTAYYDRRENNFSDFRVLITNNFEHYLTIWGIPTLSVFATRRTTTLPDPKTRRYTAFAKRAPTQDAGCRGWPLQRTPRIRLRFLIRPVCSSRVQTREGLVVPPNGQIMVKVIGDQDAKY